MELAIETDGLTRRFGDLVAVDGLGLGAGWASAATVNLIASAVLLAALVVCYRFSLPALGDLLERRERQVLDVVAREVE